MEILTVEQTGALLQLPADEVLQLVEQKVLTPTMFGNQMRFLKKKILELFN